MLVLDTLHIVPPKIIHGDNIFRIIRDNAFLKADKKVITPEEALNLIH